ncbi:MAG: hypothetical protein GY772_16135, partial [bacterium]|nr:hypothetical protein [bacterium]
MLRGAGASGIPRRVGTRGQHAAAYSDRLAALGDGQAEAGGGQLAVAEAVPQGGGEDLYVVEGRWGGAGGGGAGRATGEARARPAAAAGEASVEEVCWGVGAGAPGGGRGGAVGSARASARAEGDIVVVGGPVPAAARAVVREVEGRPVFLEENAASSGYYRRYVVRCPLASVEHADGCGRCEKKRGTGASQTRCFGELEPVAFLGVWVRAASEFGSRA